MMQIVRKNFVRIETPGASQPSSIVSQVSSLPSSYSPGFQKAVN